MNLRSARASSSKYPDAAKDNSDPGSPSSSEDASVYMAHPTSPRKRANIKSTIKSSQRVKLREIKKKSLITNEAETRAAIQACHIVRRTIIGDETKRLEKMWGMDEFYFDSTKNLVTLRADWHLAYDANAWAFVPTQAILDKIKKNPKGTIAKPYPGYKNLTSYEFVPLPKLGLNYINRANLVGDSFQTYWAKDVFDGFPILKHHSHPYFVIYNALPKLRANADVLSTEQRGLLMSMQAIYARWKRKLRSTQEVPAAGKRRRERESSDEEGMDEDSGREKAKQQKKSRKSRKKTQKTQPETAGGENTGGKQARLFSVSQFRYPTPPTSSGPDTLHDRMKMILAWINAVSVAGPPEKVPESVVHDGEAPRTGLANWHKWGVPWIPPTHHSMATSNDWAIMECGIRLTKPVVDYYPEESMQNSSDSPAE